MTDLEQDLVIANKRIEDLEAEVDRINNGWREALKTANINARFFDEAVKRAKHAEAEQNAIGTWPVKIGKMWNGCKIVGADYGAKTITLEWCGV